MDWGNDYYTFSDTNIEYIWRFLADRARARLALHGPPRDRVVPALRHLALPARAASGVYLDRNDPSLYVRFPLLDRPGESIVVWTTTPWTLPANVAAAVNPDGRYGLRERRVGAVAGRRGVHRPAPTCVRRGGDRRRARRLALRRPVRHLAPGAGVEHRVVAWDEVSLEEGTGIVHIAPGCGAEDFESKVHDLPVLTPVDEAGASTTTTAGCTGQTTTRRATRSSRRLRERGLLVRAATIRHHYPDCWRCDTPLIFRVSDDWFIAVAEVREPMLEANREVEWVPEYMGKRMDDWLRNMGDWNISRRRYYGLPLPFYPCACGHLNVIGSRRELAERSGSFLQGLGELRRPWIDRVRIGCEKCGEPV